VFTLGKVLLTKSKENNILQIHIYLIRKHLQKKLSATQKKVASNLYWAMLGKIVNILSALFVGILVARYLGPEQYGLMNYVISFVTIFNIIATFGLDDIEIRELSKQPENRNAIIGTTFRIRLFFATVAFLLIFILLWIFKSDRFTSSMILIYAITLFPGCFNVIRNYFTSIIQNEYVVKTEIIRTVIGVLIKISLLFLKAPLSLFILATVAEMLLVSSGYIISYQKKVGKIKDWRFQKEYVLFFIREAFPLVLSGAAIIIYQRIDQVMIKNMIDNESVGYFATAGKFVDLILFLPLIITQTVTPILVRLYSSDTVRYEQKKQTFFDLLVWTSVIISLIVSLSAYWLISFTYGKQYLLAVPALQIMAWKTVGMALSSSSGQIIILEGIQKWSIIRNIIGMLVCVGFNLLLIPKYGIKGSAWVTIFTVFISGFLAHIFIPTYRPIMKLQIKSIIFGWKSILHLKSSLK